MPQVQHVAPVKLLADLLGLGDARVEEPPVPVPPHVGGRGTPRSRRPRLSGSYTVNAVPQRRRSEHWVELRGLEPLTLTLPV